MPFFNNFRVDLRPTIDYSHFVEHDSSCYDVLGALRGVDLGLDGHLVEGFIVDVQQEVVILHIVTKRNLPIKAIVLNMQREQARLGQFLAKDNEYKEQIYIMQETVKKWRN